MSKEVNVTNIPHCDLHIMFFNDRAVEACYDGKTRMGSWAYMCEDCFLTYGVGLGLGRGQRLVVSDGS